MNSIEFVLKFIMKIKRFRKIHDNVTNDSCEGSCYHLSPLFSGI